MQFQPKYIQSESWEVRSHDSWHEDIEEPPAYPQSFLLELFVHSYLSNTWLNWWVIFANNSWLKTSWFLLNMKLSKMTTNYSLQSSKMIIDSTNDDSTFFNFKYKYINKIVDISFFDSRWLKCCNSPQQILLCISDWVDYLKNYGNSNLLTVNLWLEVDIC